MHLLCTITGLTTFIPHFPNVVLCHSKKLKCAQPLRFNFSKQWCKYIQCENFTIQFFRRLYWWNMLWWVLRKPPHINLFNICSHWLLLIFCFHQTWNNRTKKCTPNPEGEIFRKSTSEGTITLLLPAASENKTGKGNGGISGATRTGTHEDPLGKEDRSAWSCGGRNNSSLAASCTSLRLHLPMQVSDIPSFAWLIVWVAEEQRIWMLKSTSCQYALPFKHTAEEIFNTSVT